MRKSAMLAAMMAGALSMGATSQPYAPPNAPIRLRHARNNKPTLDREKRDRRNRIAKLSRRRNRGR